MKPLDPALRKSFALMIFGVEPKAMANSRLPTVREAILQVEYLLLKTPSLKVSEAISSCTDRILSISRSVLGSNANFIKRSKLVQNLTKYHSLYKEHTKGFRVDSITHDLKVPKQKQTSGKKSKKFSFDFVANCSKIFTVTSSCPSSSKDQTESTKRKAEIEPEIEILQPGKRARVSIVSSVGNNNNSEQELSSSDIEPEPAGSGDNLDLDPDFKPKERRIPLNKFIDPAILDDADRFNKSNLAVKKELARSGLSYTKQGVMYARRRNRITAASPMFDPPLLVGFDERKDKSRGTIPHESTIEENVSVVLYYADGSEKVAGHFIPRTGSGEDCAKGLHEFLKSKNIDLSKLIGIVSDGCPKMTGHLKGSHACFEREIGRSLLRVVCLFHAIEKHFEKVFVFFGGQTTGPSTFCAPWKILEGDVHLRKVNPKFKVLKNDFLLDLIDNMTPAERSNLSKDHQIFLEDCRVVITGELSPALGRKIGPCVQSRMTTTETRAVRSYVSERKPCKQLVGVVEFLIYCWAPIYLLSKLFPKHHFMAPKLLLLEVMLARKHLSSEICSILGESINQNGFFLHHENILMGMICSKDIKERRVAIEKILSLRTENSLTDSIIRVFHPDDYKVNFNAMDLVSLNQVPLSEAKFEPPATKVFSDDEIKSFLYFPLDLNIPLSSVAVERAVKDTTRAAGMAGNEEERNGIVQATLRSRETD